MRARLEGNRLIIRDQPFGFWLFYSIFVAGGSIALILSLTATPDATTKLLGPVIGLGNIAGGLYMIKREPASIVEIDRASGEIRVCRWYPVGKRRNAYPLSFLSAVEVEITEHSEGGSVSPRLLKNLIPPRKFFGRASNGLAIGTLSTILTALPWVQNMLGHSSLQMIFTRYYAWIPRSTRRDGSAFMKSKGVNWEGTCSEKPRGGGKVIPLFSKSDTKTTQSRKKGSR